VTKEIAELLRAEYDSEYKPDEDSQIQNQSSEQPKDSELQARDLEALAKHLNVEVAKLYDVEVPMRGDGSRVKLGELKDRYSATEGLEAEQLRLSERQQEIESELMRGRTELQEIISQLPRDALKPEVFKAAQTQMQARQARESRAILDVIPDWQDSSTRESELQSIGEHLQGYGLSRKWLESQMDHRLLKYVRDQWRRAQHVQKVLDKVKPVSKQQGPSKPPKGAPTRSSPSRPQGPTRTTSDMTQKVSDLLTRGNRNG